MIRLPVLFSVFFLSACGGMQAAPPGMPTPGEVQVLQGQTSGIPLEALHEFYTSGLTLVQMRCGGFFDQAVMDSLKAAQNAGQLSAAAGLASALMGLGNVPTPYTAGAGAAGGFLGAILANQQTNSLAGNRPAGLATLTAAAQQAIINATPEPRTGADTYAALYATYRPCSPAGIEALKEQAINAAASHLTVTSGSGSPVGLIGGRTSLSAPSAGRALPMVLVK